MHPRFSAYLSAALIDRRDGHRRKVLARFEQLRRFDFYSDPLREELRCRALADLLTHARSRVPRFRALLGGRVAITPENAREILARLPPMRRADIQAEPAAFQAEGGPPSVDDYTGGSSGTPLTFKVDRATQQAREASLMWANSLAGWRPGDRIAMLWGSDRDAASALRDWRLHLRWWIDNLRWYNAFSMGEAQMAAFHRAMTRFCPHLLVAYAGSLDVYARYLETVAHPGSRLVYPLTSIVSSAEMLTRQVRERVERVFGKPVFDRYGNREAGAIAAECEAHHGLHLNEHDFIVEIDSPNPQRDPGPLLLTYLANRAMPLIRYDTGDLAVWEKGACACGRLTRRLARIAGRQSDTIRTPSGKLIHGEYFTHLLYGAPGVRSFQFVQETMRDYRLLVEMESPMDERLAAGWRAKISAALGADCNVVVERVDRIPVLPSGKRKFTLSKL